MKISSTELEQMLRDGRGRPAVVKALVAHYQQTQQLSSPDSVLLRGRWVHYLSKACQGGGEILRVRHRDGTESEVELR